MALRFLSGLVLATILAFGFVFVVEYPNTPSFAWGSDSCLGIYHVVYEDDPDTDIELEIREDEVLLLNRSKGIAAISEIKETRKEEGKTIITVYSRHYNETTHIHFETTDSGYLQQVDRSGEEFIMQFSRK